MEIKGKVHCLFEQSGTFKNEFRKLGYEAYDYDIQDEFGETDHVVDLFGEIEKAYATMMNTAAQCGLKVVSDDTCCKVLAWLYVHGGGYEVGFNTKLLADIKYAQKRLNLYGSEIPDSELCETLRARVKELEVAVKTKSPSPEWLLELKERYNLPDYAIRGYWTEDE